MIEFTTSKTVSHWYPFFNSYVLLDVESKTLIKSLISMDMDITWRSILIYPLKGLVHMYSLLKGKTVENSLWSHIAWS